MQFWSKVDTKLLNISTHVKLHYNQQVLWAAHQDFKAHFVAFSSCEEFQIPAT